MINPLLPTNPTPLKAVAPGVSNVTPSQVVSTVQEEAPAAVTTPAARLAKEGAPVDGAKVARIKARIADGSYKADAHAIASRMVDLDLPERL